MRREKELGRRVQAAEERQDLIPASHIVQMANPYTCCCSPALLHDSNQILTQPTDISYPVLTCFQTCALKMSEASQSFLVITPSPSAITTPEKHSHHPTNLASPSELLPCHYMYLHEISSFYSPLYLCLFKWC